jgi:hypothetical protein
MNTPAPCDTCNHCKWNCVTEDDPTESAYCDEGLQMGNDDCPKFSAWSKAKRRLITYAMLGSAFHKGGKR